MKALLPYIRLMRVDNWFKNVLVLPGVVLAYVMAGHDFASSHLPEILLGLLAICLTASANYTINEITDAPTDKAHPDKQDRPIPSGKVRVPMAWVQYAVLTLVALGLGYQVNLPFFCALSFLWLMGLVYNIPPLRTKEITYLDALTEAVNNPIRLMLGWWLVCSTSWPPASIVAGYWMLGAFLMALKRHAEYRHIGDHDRAVRYRRSFEHTDDLRLLISAVIYSNAFFLLLGVFIAKFRVELILSVPFLALSGAYYLRVAFRPNSLVQYPEKLYRERKLAAMGVLTAAVVLALLFVDVPVLHHFFRMPEPSELVPIHDASTGPDAPAGAGR